jgi:hypothetical protein
MKKRERNNARRKTSTAPVAPFDCLKCARSQDCITNPFDDSPPRPGLHVVCLYCGNAMILVELSRSRTVVRRPTVNELISLYSSEDGILLVAAVQRLDVTGVRRR